MLASTIVVPVAGKLSDIYGASALHDGIVVFAVGSALSGIAPNFWFLVFSRFVQEPGWLHHAAVAGHHRRHHLAA